MKKETCGYLDGGHVKGPGTETSDSIHARLSNGEFVVKAKVVQQPGVLDFLKQLNDEKLVQKFQEGGLAGTIQKFQDFMAPYRNNGTYQRDPSEAPQTGYEDAPKYTTQDITPVESSMLPTMTNPNPVNPSVSPKQIITPEQRAIPQSQTAPIPEGINYDELNRRLAEINANRNNPEKFAQLQQSLSEHMQNAFSKEDLLKIDKSRLHQYAEGGEVYGYKGGGPAIDDSLFEDVPYNASQDDSLFEDVSHPDSTPRTLASEALAQPENLPKVGAGRSFLVGSASGSTFGFPEEITAPFMAAAANISGVPRMKGEGGWEKYLRLMQDYRDMAREEQKAAQEQNPWSYGGGALAGGLLSLKVPVPGVGGALSKIPGAAKATELLAKASKAAPITTKLAKGAAIGAGYGAAYGAGEAEGTPIERIPGAIQGAETGAELGTILPAAGIGYKALKGVGKITSEIPIVEDTLQNIKYGMEGQPLATKAGVKEVSDVLDEVGYNWYNELDALRTKIGKEIGNKVDEATQAGEKIDLTDEVKSALDKLKEIKGSGVQESESFATLIENKIRKLFDLKVPKVEKIPETNLPEGLNPKMVNPTVEQKIEEVIATPAQAQELKQILYENTPHALGKTKAGITPQQYEGAGVAKSLSKSSAEKLEEAVPELSNKEYVNPEGQTQTALGLNKEYNIAENIIDDLKIPESKSKLDIKDAIFRALSQSEKLNMSGHMLRRRVAEVFDQIKQISPELAAKYKDILPDIIEKNVLAAKNIRGGEAHGLIGTSRALVTSAGNAIGLGLNKLGVTKLVNKVGDVAEGVANSKVGEVANTLAKRANLPASTVGGGIEKNVSKITEPYQFQRKVANAAENAEPELLMSQAKQIREQYGNQGEQLATMLDNMVPKTKQARRALMFSILQNKAYRKMLGITQGEE